MKLFGMATLAALALVGGPNLALGQTSAAAPSPVVPSPATPSPPLRPAPGVTGEPAPPAVAAPTASDGVAAPTPPAAAPASAVVAPAATPQPAPAQRVTVSPGHALVHVAVNYPDAWLETRKYVDAGEFLRTCRTPCDTTLDVQGLEARVVAPGMTTSNAFRFDSGTGTAGVRVDGGSATARTVGIMTLAIGIPVALAGMALFGLGRTRDETGMKVAGIAGLAAGGLSIGVSFPLLLLGTTRVKSADGDRIASQSAPSPQN